MPIKKDSVTSPPPIPAGFRNATTNRKPPKIAAPTAAWINGSASHSVEFDDIFRDAVYHPGCPVIAAALAMAEDRRKSGRELLAAVTVAYEISTRIGAAVQPSHYKFFHTTGTLCLLEI